MEYLGITLGFAAPEVLAYQLQPDDNALFGEISFQAQECWSLGCVLVWLLIGTDPFTTYREERLVLGLHVGHHGHDYSECVSNMQSALFKKQAAWVKPLLLLLEAPPCTASS